MGQGIDFLLDFIDEKYLKEYVKDGGSKIKFITGRYGSGKSYFLEQLNKRAIADNYLLVSLDSRKAPLYDFRSIYLEILSRVDLEGCLGLCARQIIRSMDYDPEAIPSGKSFAEYLSSRNEANIINMAAIRTGLKEMFLDNPYLDRSFAQGCALLCAGLLGYPSLDASSRNIILGWMQGNKDIKIAMVKALGISASPINKTNARHLLRSLSEIVHLSGYSGLFVSIDNLDYIQEKFGEEVKYTKLRRDDTYEIIRELIDDIDSLAHVMFVFAFDKELIDNEKSGFKSYQALWMRIQNEIRSKRFNRFADICDLDELARQEYDEEYLLKMAKMFMEEGRNYQFYPLPDKETLAKLKEDSAYATIGLPLYLKEKLLQEETQ